MKIDSLAQNPLGAWCAEHDRTRKPRQHVTQAKTAIEPVSRFGQIAPHIFALPDRVIDTVECALDVAQTTLTQRAPLVSVASRRFSVWMTVCA